MASSSPVSANPRFRERLIPGPGLYLALLLLLPAVTLAVTPLTDTWAVPIAVGVTVTVALALTLLSPVVRVIDGTLEAGAARIPLDCLGDAEVLDRATLREAIGPGLDARSFLVVRGYIHRGLRISVTDPEDPTPQWIITTRRPEELLAAVRASRSG